MSADDGMDALPLEVRAKLMSDGIDWEARAKAAEHSNKVLTAALEKAQKRLAEEDTVWNKDARAALQGLLASGNWEDPEENLTETTLYADALEKLRQARP